MLVRITDSLHVYPIQTVEVEAETIQEAKQIALAAMMGCRLDEVDDNLVQQALDNLEVYATPRG